MVIEDSVAGRDVLFRRGTVEADFEVESKGGRVFVIPDCLFDSPMSRIENQESIHFSLQPAVTAVIFIRTARKFQGVEQRTVLPASKLSPSYCPLSLLRTQ